MSAEDLFWAKVEKTEGCWLWTACTSARGYGRVTFAGRVQMAHRVSYLLTLGPIPEDKELDHLCRVKNCVRPDHLDPVPHRVNVQRGDAGKHLVTHYATRTHCGKGHALTPDNLLRAALPGRQCRRCNLDRQARSYAARKVG
jgi:hypothetical protein